MTEPQKRSAIDSSTWGLILGMISSIAYMTANLGLRSVAGGHESMSDVDWAIWVATNRVFPVVTTAWTVVAIRALRGLKALPPAKIVLPLIATGLFMQWGGNVGFQFALSRVGLAITVPLTFATVLLSAAIVGRLVINDPLTPYTVWAMVAMMGAVTVLSQGTERATAAMVQQSDIMTIVLGVGTACLAGVAYGSGGVMIRRCVTGDISQSAVIAVLSSTGFISLGSASLWRIGLDKLLETPVDQWLRMLGAGVATAVAFFAITGAYRFLTTIKVNLLNASQAAMAAVAGVLLFDEPNTIWLQLGTILTIVGLILSAQRDKPEQSRQKAPETASTTSVDAD
ncbi:MAG: DMT family transporter [Planctomycetaceae bacterium]|nr:DMT family transporter [Planctomycetaceae bacterium]